MRGATLFAVPMLFVAVGAARAQDALEFVSDRETAAQLSRIVESVRGKGLPVEPVVAKARRGVQVHAPSTRIITAAQAVASRLEVARDALGPKSPAADIAAGEDALSTPGVTKQMLQLIRAAQPSKPIVVPLGVMAQLVASGVKPAYAAEIIARLTRADIESTRLVSLGNDVNQDVLAGIAAMTAIDTRLQTLRPLLARIPTPTPVQGALAGSAADPKGRP